MTLPWPKRITTRIAAIAAAVVLGQFVLLLWWAFSASHAMRAHVFGPVLETLQVFGDLDACDASPTTWKTRGAFPIYALRDDGRPYNPDAPELRTAPAPPAPARVAGPVHDALPAFSGTVYETARPGVCHRFVISPLIWSSEVRDERIWLFSTRVLIDLGVVLALVGFIALPLARRIRRMSQEANAIVAEDFRGEVTVSGDELGELGRRFNDAAATARERLAELERREQQLRDTLADLAHDVRTPLTSLKLGLASMRDSDNVTPLRAEVEYLDAMFSNLSSLAQLEGQAIVLEAVEVDMTRLIEHVATRFAVLAADRQVHVEAVVPDDTLPVTGDPVALEQLIGNLVHNAVKFAAHDVVLSVFGRANAVVVEVLDDGPGVSFHDLPRLTERRFQGERQTDDRGRPGQGLGLAIANELAHRHHGTLTVRHAPDGGTLAELRLARATT